MNGITDDNSTVNGTENPDNIHYSFNGSTNGTNKAYYGVSANGVNSVNGINGINGTDGYHNIDTNDSVNGTNTHTRSSQPITIIDLNYKFSNDASSP
ncbi:MAG: hypothetical protein LQ340_005760 [Diploschistes diacapsis]|nr:MAG: hypothetical protein LQ340_005760 [Diploschistes diacapsis]